MCALKELEPTERVMLLSTKDFMEVEMKCPTCGTAMMVKEHGIGCGKVVPVDVCPYCLTTNTDEQFEVAMGRIWQK